MKGEEVGIKERVSEGQEILYRILRGLFSDSDGVALMVLSLC